MAEQGGDGSRGVSLSSLVCEAANKTQDPSLYSVTLEGSVIHRLSPADMLRHRSLEEGLTQAYSGVRRGPLEFESCILHMDATTDNTRRPYCIVNGEHLTLQTTAACVCVCVRAQYTWCGVVMLPWLLHWCLLLW